MKLTFTGNFFAITFAIAILLNQSKAQTIQGGSASIINNLPVRTAVFTGSSGLKKSSSCGSDTVNYTFNKTTLLNTVTLNNVSSGNAFAQWYPSPQAITVSGFEFFAWQTAMTGAVIPLTCRMYAAGIDSMPSGLPLASVTVNVDSTFGGGTLTTLRKKAIFPSAVTTSSSTGYVLTVETSSGTNVAVVTNAWNATPPNGRSEWCSSVRIGASFIRSYNINISGTPFNADFILQPFVTYNLNASFTSSANCITTGNPITFTNTSSPVLFSKFYSVRAFFNITQFSCLWDYGDTTGTYYAINGGTTYNFNVTHRVKLLDTLYGWTNGCGDTYTKDIYQSPDPTNASNNSPICAGGTLQLFADSVPGATYVWSGPNGFTSTQRNPEIPSAGVAASGLYSVFTVIGQCSSSVSTCYVSVINSYSASSNGPLCVGQNLSLNSTPITGATYAWTGPNSFTSTIRNPLRNGVTKADSGTYQVTISLPGCGVLGPFSTLVIVNDIPATPTVSNNGPLCVGQNLSLTASGPSSAAYNWFGPNNFSSTQQNPVRPSSVNTFAGTYTVTLTQNGCTSAMGSTNVVVNSIPSAPTAGNNGPLCSGQTLSLTASLISGATYTWSGPNGFTSSTQNPTRTGLSLLDGGTYSVIASVNGCPSSAATTNVTITNSTPAPTVSSNGPLCPGQNLQLSATGIAGATFSWTGPKGFTSNLPYPIIPSVTDSNAGVYTVTATTGSCGTSSAANVTVVINSLPAAPNVGSNSPVCEGELLSLTASPITGANYYWTGPNGFTSNAQNPSSGPMTKTKAGAYSVYVTVPGCGTSGTSSTTAIVRSVPANPQVTSNAPVCIGDSIKFIANSTGVGPNASYTWTGPNNFTAIGSIALINSALNSDNGIFRATVTDSGCTSANGSLNVLVKNLPSTPVPSSNSPICSGSTLNLQSTLVLGTTYFWSGPNGYTSTAQNPSVLNADPKNSGLYALSSVMAGCKSIPATLNILINSLPESPTATNTGPACVGDNINLRASSITGATYNWSGPSFSSTLQNPILVSATKQMSGSYSVSATVSGCTSPESKTDVVVNNYPEAPVLSSNPSLAACTGDSLKFYANNVTDGIFEWSGPLGFASNKQNPVLFINSTAQSGAYFATVNRYGCLSPKSTLNISVHGTPTTSAISGLSDVKSGETSTYTVSGSSGSTYDWIVTGGSIQTGIGSPSITVLWGAKGTGTVKVSETNSPGCKGIGQTKAITIGAPAGVSEKGDFSTQIVLFPNPAESSINLDINSDLLGDLSYGIYDMTGRLLQQYELEKGANFRSVQIPLSNYSAGFYMVKVKLGNSEGVKTFIIK
ncbi:MAG: hypothetical protein CFE21_13330 [Bacteroidetes bacterium B1(2017)]|nr:MAG: hypothetical protein CFE21_13330 [Bacteroidetes bacterium B1(2017)]